MAWLALFVFIAVAGAGMKKSQDYTDYSITEESWGGQPVRHGIREIGGRWLWFAESKEGGKRVLVGSGEQSTDTGARYQIAKALTAKLGAK